MADSLQFPPELQARLDAAGVTDQDSLLAALRADPDLERDYRAFLEANREPERSEQIQQLLATFAAVPDRNALTQSWAQVPPALEDALFSAVEAEITQQEQAGWADAAEGLRRSLERARQLQEQRRVQGVSPVTRAVDAFLQAPNDDDARRLFAEQRGFLQPYESQQLAAQFAQQASDEHRTHLAGRTTLLRTLRGTAPQPEPASTLAAPEHATLAFQTRDVQVVGDLMQAGGSIYINSVHVEAGGNAVVINNIRVEYRWTRPRPPQLLRPMLPRQSDLDAARAKLLQHGALAITGAPAMGIQGMPGVGKTTLAQQLALLLDQDYPDGVIWQPVGPDIQTPEQVQPILTQWARYALILPADLNAVQFEVGAVRALLAEHPRLLVVLDNVWSLEAIRPLREALPTEAHLVITTRSRNVLIGLGHGYELGLLSTEDARRLVALRLGWGEIVPPEQQAWCDALIQGVGFHTLALDVALGVLRREGDTPEEWRATAERLVAYLRVGRDFADLRIPEADRGLHVERVLAYSYERMASDTQRCFRLLGALAPDADFTTAAAGALWEQDEATARRSLHEFVNAALLMRSGSGRWQQHALLRGYALALLRRAGDHEQASAHHAAHYATAMEHVVKASQVNSILPEQPQLRHAFVWAVENDLGLAFRLEAGTAELRALFGPAVEQLAWAEQLQAAARERGTAGDQARVLVALGNALQQMATAPGQERASRLAAALSAYDEALLWYQPDTAPLDYATTQHNRANLLRELAGLRGEDRRRRLETALSAYDEALRFSTPDTAPLNYAGTQNNRANLLSELAGLGGEDRHGRLQAALSAYDEALRFRTPDTAPLAYAATQNNRGVLLSELAGLPGEDRRGRLLDALSAYDEALRWYQPDTAPLNYAGTQNNRANLLRESAGLPGEDRRGWLLDALSAYDEALRFRMLDTAPLDYAATQNNRAVLLRELAGLPGEDRRGRLLDALSTYDEALRFRTHDVAPLSYGMTQNNRAMLLSELAGLPGEDRRGRLLASLQAYYEALRFLTPDTAPLSYGMTQNNRANLLRELAGLGGEDRRGRLLDALSAYDEALRFRTPDTAPLDYAATQNNRAVLLSDLAGLGGEDRRGRLLDALSAYDEALRFRTPDTAPLDYATTQNNRAVLLSELAGLGGEDRRGRLLDALSAYDEALRFRTPDTAPLDYAMTQNNRAMLLSDLAGLPGEDQRVQLLDALSAYDEALRWYQPDTAPLQYAATQNNRAVLLSALAGLPGEDRRGRLGEALRIACEALGWFEHLEHAPYTEVARRTLRDLCLTCGDLFGSLWEKLDVGLVPDWLQQLVTPEMQAFVKHEAHYQELWSAAEATPDDVAAWQTAAAAGEALLAPEFAGLEQVNTEALHTHLAVTYIRLRVAQIQAQALDQALVAQDRVITLQPQAAWPRLNRVVILANLGRLDEAVEELERARALEPDNLNVGQLEAALAQARIQATDEPEEPSA